MHTLKWDFFTWENPFFGFARVSDALLPGAILPLWWNFYFSLWHHKCTCLLIIDDIITELSRWNILRHITWIYWKICLLKIPGNSTFLSIFFPTTRLPTLWKISVNLYQIWWQMRCLIRESPSQFENRIMARMYVRSITHSSMYQKVPFC